MTSRGGFIKAIGASALCATVGDAFAAVKKEQAVVDYKLLQEEIDEITPEIFRQYLKDDSMLGTAANWLKKFNYPALQRLDDAFAKVVEEVKAAKPTKEPAVWIVYNMGIVVKTKETCFSVDLHHRLAQELAPELDFALITHNHDDHYTEKFYRAMDRAGKVVISNFLDNYGTRKKDMYGGYTRANKVFNLKDVEIRTSLTDHNSYLIDFTTAFEIRVGKFTIFHSGDCYNLAKLNPVYCPDLWIVHPRCGTDVAQGVKKISPKLTVIAHLNELGHAKNNCRWTWEEGFKAVEKAKSVGGKAIVPVWGERLV